MFVPNPSLRHGRAMKRSGAPGTSRSDPCAARAGLCLALWLAAVAGCARSHPPPAPPAATRTAGDLDASRLAAAAREPEQWFTNGRDGAGTYYSPLAGINRETAPRLGFAWQYPLGTRRGLEATPVVVDGIMYAAGNFGRVYSLDAATGRERWTYDPQVDGRWARYACCDAVNRGLALWKGRVYVGSLDGYLHAIDARSGQRLWRVDTLLGRAQQLPYTSPGFPVVAGKVVVIGNAGADFRGVRGYVSAFDLETGALKWRFFTVPRDPKLGAQDQPHLVEAVKTWDPRHRWEFGGGGTVWDGISYDPDLNLLYVGTANASPYTIKEGGRRGGDDLYAASIIAIHADTGQMAWYYQVVPGDEWDYDSTQKMILADLQIGTQLRRVLMQASKNGFFYVIDRATGELISAKSFAYTNWTKGLDPRSGRPIPTPEAEYLQGPKLIYPSMAGAHTWQPMSFSAQTGLVYIPALEAPMVYIETARRPAGLIEGNFTVAGFFPEDYDPKVLAPLFGALPSLASLAAPAAVNSVRSVGVLKAWDPVKGQVVWERPLPTFWSGGVLSTGGEIVVQGDAEGMLVLYDARTGNVLRKVDVGTGIIAAPMTYAVHGEQYLAFMAGYGGGPGLYAPFPPNTAAYKYGNAGRIVALKLGGGEVPRPPLVEDEPFPQPPAREARAGNVAHGAVLYNRHCGRCHTFGRGELPDLRRMAAPTHAIFDAIVLQGAYAPRGMGRFDDVLSAQDAHDIHAFLVDQAWDAFRNQQAATHP
ncbi:MAG: PQQ-dependent dehydrogenase, methanol/ethanol family [Proteobacteria bacterium]|nr:PQQ-dependent dehydrogenase, methanol/ethanol family [Pseudomonadota bacterium]